MQQPRESDIIRTTQLDNLKSILQYQSMRLTEICANQTIDLHQTETAHAQELKIVKSKIKEIRELEHKREQIALQMTALMSNRSELHSKVGHTVEFAKALSEHGPRALQTVTEKRKACDAEQAGMDALGAAADALLANFTALNARFNSEMLQLHNDVCTEREARVLEITRHNQAVSELEHQIKEKMHLSCKDYAINTDHQAAIDNEQKQLVVVRNESESLETELKAQLAQAGGNLKEMQSRLPKHQEEIEKGLASKREYQKLMPLMKMVEIEQGKYKEFLAANGIEKVKFIEKLEEMTKSKENAEQDICNEIKELEKYMASEQATRDSRVILIDKLEIVENKLVENNEKKSELELSMKNFHEIKVNIDVAREELISNFSNLQILIEKADVDNKMNKEQLDNAERNKFDLEEETNTIIEKIQQVDADSLTVETELENIRRAIAETRGQIELILADKAELIKQVAAIDSVLESIRVEKIDFVERLKTETDISSELNENVELEEKIKAALLSTEILEKNLLEKEVILQRTEAEINIKCEELDCTTINVETITKHMESITDYYNNGIKLLESAQLSLEKGTNENLSLKRELEIVNKKKESKEMERKIIEDELEINTAIVLSTIEQEEALRILNQELVQEEEEATKIVTDFKKSLEMKLEAVKNTLNKVVALQQKKNAYSKDIAAAEADFNANAAAELEVADKLKGVEMVSAKAQALHEMRLQAIVQADKDAVEDQSKLEQLEARLLIESEGHSQQLDKISAVILKINELENTLASKSSSEEAVVEFLQIIEKLKREEKQLDDQLKDVAEHKALRRSHVRSVSTEWKSQMVALKELLLKEQKRVEELQATVTNNSKSKSPLSMNSAEKSLSVVSVSSSGSRSKSPGKSQSKGKLANEKSPIPSRRTRKSPILSGSHLKVSMPSHAEVRPVELWNVNACSTPIPTGNYNLQEKLSPDEIPNSPIIQGPMPKKMKKNK